MIKISLLTFLQVIIFIISAFSQNTNLGSNAGNSGTNNTSIGASAGDVVTGDANTFVGMRAGFTNTTGSNNAALGYYSGSSLTTGYTNTFVGSYAGTLMTTGNSNTFIGNNTGNSIGNNNSFIGSGSGGDCRGNENVGVGKNSCYTGTGNNNVALGNYAARSLGTGNNNTILGDHAGYSLWGGSSNVFIGYNAGYNEAGSNKLYIDNSNTTVPLIYGDFNSNQVGINASPVATHALTVGGTLYSTGNIYATGIYVNGNSITDAGFEFWNKVGTNIWNRSDNVGIGVDLSKNPNNYRLGVKGKIGAQEVQIENNSLTWSDFVFKDDYKLITLEELEHYIKVNKHLPEIPTEAEVRKDGLLVSEMNAKLLQKVEELTLYVIELKKEVEALKAKK